ncbi:serine hydrolase [Runella salmonicolor]|uniref:Serine hydrolase n=1 Tax=Runella salmonicolor TaxID=2950278 RepID=A0ABT1FGX7_9BACT|nr:serine hydrolase [Runella salmonicolor]MCP1381016.1 serine hydrolase [Runella salmonicolor]
MKTLKILFVSIWCFTTGIVLAQSTTLTSEFDKLLTDQFKPAESGATVLVAQKGKIIYQKAFGQANLELNVPMQPSMVFRIGSITKQFTAVAILQLMEQGKLSLEDEITKFIPDYPTHGHKITVEHLLTHTSGIKSYTDMKEFGDVIQKDMKPEELINFFKNQPMDFAPGTQWHYNNSGFFLLGYIIEKVSGKTYPDYVEQVFFKPLGMTHSYYGNDAKLIPNRAAGYERGKDGIQNASPMSMTLPYAAGSIQSTVEDLWKWHQAVHAYQLVRKETLEKAFTPYKLANGKPTNYGYGWFLGDIQGSATIEHGGGINGFLTSSIYLPKEDVFVAVFSNSTAKSPDNVAAKLAAWAIEKPYNFKEVALDENTLKGYIGVYENPEAGQRIISLENGKLYSQRTGGPKSLIKPYEKDKFFFETSLSFLNFQRNVNQMITGVISSQRGAQTMLWTKTDKPIPTRMEQKVDETILAKYTGDYQLAPGFILSITQEVQKLFAQATGQGKNELFAESETKFFLKVVDAQVEFFKNESGQVDKLILYQGGQKIEGKKMK